MTSNILDTPAKPDLIQNAYGGASGNFGLLTKHYTGKFAIQWHSCREEFAQAAKIKVNEKSSSFMFFAPNKKLADIAEFIGRFETLVEMGRRKPLHRTTFQRLDSGGKMIPGNENSIVWVNPSLFWYRQPMRHSLLTMLLRCANNGYVAGGDFYQALFHSYVLATGCKTSIMKFLDGYTWYTGDNDGTTNGWYYCFHNLDNLPASDQWKVLIRPKAKSEMPKVG